jgi:ribosomal protein S18 acetylase RimI-like enzyme
MTECDVSGVVDVHIDAFKGYMNVALGRGYLKAFIRWFARNPAASAFVGEFENQLIGYVVGAPFGYGRMLSRDLWPVGALALAARPYLLLQRRVRRTVIHRVRRMFDSMAEQRVELGMPTMSLVGIALGSSYRRRGCGEALLAAFEARARQQGMMSYCLSVYHDNIGARQFYEKHGMVCDDVTADVLRYSKTLLPQTEQLP